MSIPFKIGDRVKMTNEAKRNFTSRRGSPNGEVRGAVVSLIPEREIVRVKRDDCKVAESWHWKFWELES